jgi:hypothetical protein
MATTNKKPAAAGPATQGLKVTARSEQGMRRAGRFWPAEGAVVPLSELTVDQVEQLQAERGLIISEVTLPAADKA